MIADAATAGVGQCRADRGLVAIEPAQPALSKRFRPTALECRLAHGLPGGHVVTQPALESEATAGQPGGHVRGHQGGLDHQRAGSAHRVDEGGTRRGHLGPTAAQQQRRREVLLERRLDAGLPVASAVQRVAAQIDGE